MYRRRTFQTTKTIFVSPDAPCSRRLLEFRVAAAQIHLALVASRVGMAFSRLQSATVVVGFSAISAWYGFMFGKESARKELADKIIELRDTIQKLESHDNA